MPHEWRRTAARVLEAARLRRPDALNRMSKETSAALQVALASFDDAVAEGDIEAANLAWANSEKVRADARAHALRSLSEMAAVADGAARESDTALLG